MKRFVDLFEQLTPQAVARLGEVYAPGVQFKDPFNELTGVAPVQRVFEHMFKTLDNPRFLVREVVGDRRQCFITWDHYCPVK